MSQGFLLGNAIFNERLADSGLGVQYLLHIWVLAWECNINDHDNDDGDDDDVNDDYDENDDDHDADNENGHDNDYDHDHHHDQDQDDGHDHNHDHDHINRFLKGSGLGICNIHWLSEWFLLGHRALASYDLQSCRSSQGKHAAMRVFFFIKKGFYPAREEGFPPMGAGGSPPRYMWLWKQHPQATDTQQRSTFQLPALAE